MEKNLSILIVGLNLTIIKVRKVSRNENSFHFNQVILQRILIK